MSLSVDPQALPGMAFHGMIPAEGRFVPLNLQFQKSAIRLAGVRVRSPLPYWRTSTQMESMLVMLAMGDLMVAQVDHML